MSNDDLLQLAEKALSQLTNIEASTIETKVEIAKAASLLVIARNTVRTTTNTVTELFETL